ncbi:MAG TPA: DEAD/DEAH box helicase [Candidatus Binataceae bacterium]|nr:DEAD/DEAH box helicase [Candidatus Binataceae bacterium]
MIELRPYQTAAVDAIRTAYRSGRKSVLLQAATGAGKTVLFSHFAAKLKLGYRALVLVHRDELLRQTADKFEQFGIEYGMIGAGYSRSRARIQIASVMTLVRRLHEHEPFDFVIIDETHHLPSASFKKIVQHYPDAYRLGCTATPARLDGQGLSEFFDILIKGPPMAELVAQGYLAACEVYGPPTSVDLSMVHIRAGDYAKNELEGAMDKAVITGDAVEHYRRIVGSKPAIAFCVSIKHAEHVAEKFRQGGFAAASIDGTMDMSRRRNLIADLAAGRLNVLTSCDLITEGLDVPAAKAIILLRPTQSLTLFLQAVGRGMRPKPDGSACIVLDHVKNCERFGLPQSDREWTLEGRKLTAKQRQEQQIATRTCEKCFSVLPTGLKLCPKCQTAVVIHAREIEERPGELVRLTPEQRLALWRDEQKDPNVKLVRTTIDSEWENRERRRLIASGRPRAQVEAIIHSKRKKILAARA